MQRARHDGRTRRVVERRSFLTRVRDHRPAATGALDEIVEGPRRFRRSAMPALRRGARNSLFRR
jgi:hypothetical protein